MTAPAVAWAEVADLLDAAADELVRRGWCQGYNGDDGSDPDGCRVCADGALYAATTGDPWPDPADSDSNRLLRLHARRVLREVADAPAVTSWNDTKGRTAEQVVAAVRQAARVARGRAA